MRAVVVRAFGTPPELTQAPDPACPPDGVVVAVEATGLCRSDWHGWMGHDSDITTFPHVPGHELAGVVEAVAKRQPRMAATSAGTSSGTRTRLTSARGSATRSAKEPHWVNPGWSWSSQTCPSPRAQARHRPQARTNGVVTRSPT